MAKLEDYESALIAADKAGNVEDATRLARVVSNLRASPPEETNPTATMSGGQKFLAGVGKGYMDIGRGAGQIARDAIEVVAPPQKSLSDLVTGGQGTSFADKLGLPSSKSVAETRALEKPLMDTKAGTFGNVAGTIAAGAVPTLLLPSVGGAALVGGGLNALQPVGEGESRLKNTAMGAALGAGAQFGIGKLAQAAGSRLAAAEAGGAASAAQNAVRDATLREAQQAGYAVPPSQAGAGIVPRVLEGISGKYKTNQAAAVKNQNVTDRLARQALGIADDAPLTRETMQVVRDRAYQSGYEPLANAGAVETDTIFKKALDNIVQDYQGASRSFPGAVKNDVMNRVDSLRTGAFDTGDALKMTRILRDEANAAFVQGDKALGKATKEAANAIEGQIERALQSAGVNGAELLKNFRDARQLMAKAHNVEKALVEGGGQVNAKVLGAALQRGKPLSGELKTIGGFANNFKDVAGVPQSGWASPITALDAFGAAGMAGMGAGPMSIALPAARLASRAAVTNPAFQRSFVHPSYGPGLLGRAAPMTLEEMRRLGLGGLLGSTYSAQK